MTSMNFSGKHNKHKFFSLFLMKIFILNEISNVYTKKNLVKNATKSTEEVPVAVVAQLIDSLIINKHFEQVFQKNSQGDKDKSHSGIRRHQQCTNGELRFSGKILSDYTRTFEVILASSSIQECVQECYELGCVRAAYTHFPRSACLLNFAVSEPELSKTCSTIPLEKLDVKWEFSSIPEVVELECVRCVREDGSQNDDLNEKSINTDLSQVKFEDEKQQNDGKQPIDITHFRNANLKNNTRHHKRQIVNPQGLTNKCTGRVEFQVAPVASLPRLNITNDVPADSAADCARKCLEREGCQLAGFIPTPGHDSASGVCLLTSDLNNDCLDPEDPKILKNTTLSKYTTQHASTVPFLISCIRCSSCNYSLSLASPGRQLPYFSMTVEAQTVDDCAKECAHRNCHSAQFDSNNQFKPCSLAFAGEGDNDLLAKECAIETALQTDGIFPVILDCVECANNNINN